MGLGHAGLQLPAHEQPEMGVTGSCREVITTATRPQYTSRKAGVRQRPTIRPPGNARGI